MDLKSTYDDLPWDLFASALRGELSLEEEVQLHQWLALSGENREIYHRLQLIWKEGMTDYVLYHQADEVKAWEALRNEMGDTVSAQEKGAIIRGSFEKRGLFIKRLVAVAAVFLLAMGAGWWYFVGKKGSIQYETTAGEQKKISMPDGSTVVLSPATRMQFAGNYNKSNRTVILAEGEAVFEVSHQAQLPFVVSVGAASIKDIGTSFSVRRMKDSINVKVFSGKVSFIKNVTGEARELSAGMSLCYYINGQHFGEIRPAAPAKSANSLQFYNAPLSDVIAALQTISGKKILLKDSAIGREKLTVRLGGQSFDNAMKIICASLNLEYSVENGTYTLKNKDTATRH